MDNKFDNLAQRRTTATVLGISIVISLSFLMYAFVQKAEADKLSIRIEEERIKYEQLQHEYLLTTKTLEDCIRQSEELKDKAVSK